MKGNAVRTGLHPIKFWLVAQGERRSTDEKFTQKEKFLAQAAQPSYPDLTEIRKSF